MTEIHLYLCLRAGDFEAEINLELSLKSHISLESGHVYIDYVIEIIGDDDDDDLRRGLLLWPIH